MRVCLDREKVEKNLNCVYFSILLEMGHSAANLDDNAYEVTKDWNGIDQVVLRNSQGASVKVRSFSSPLFRLSPM